MTKSRSISSWQSVCAIGGIVVLWLVVPVLLGKGIFRHLSLAYGIGTLLLGLAGLATAAADGRARISRKASWVGATLLVVGAFVPLVIGPAVERAVFVDRVALLTATIVAYFGARAAFASGRNRALRKVVPQLALATLALHLAAGCWRFFVRGEPRMAGFVLQPNFFATTVAALAIPLVLPLLATKRRSLQCVFGGVALVVALACSGSRAALGIALVVAFVYVLASPGGRRLGAIVGAGGAVLLLALTLIPNPLKSRLESKVDQTFPRPFIWERAARIAASHPLGIGLGMHRWYFARDAWIESEPSLSNRRHEIGIAHNVVLGAAAEAGIVGGVGVAACSLAFAALVFTARRRFARPTARAWYCGALVLLLHAQVDGVAQSAAALGVLAVVAAAAEARLAPRPLRTRGGSPVMRALPAAFVTALALAPVALNLLVAGRLRDAATALARGDVRAARAGYDAATEWIGENAPAALGLVDVARRETDVASASWSPLAVEFALAAAVRANPFDARPLVQLADLRRNRHFIERRTDRHLLHAARDAYDRALAADPLALAVRMMRSRLERELGDLDAAVADLEEVLRLEPNHPLALEQYGDLEMGRGNRQAAMDRWLAAVQAYLSAHLILGDGRYGTLPYLIEIVTGFDPKACEAKIYAAQRGG